jgi:hypothetical protein
MARAGKRIQVQLTPAVYEVLGQESEKLGISRSAYISMLIMKNKTESSAVEFLSTLTPNQISEAFKENKSK